MDEVVRSLSRADVIGAYRATGSSGAVVVQARRLASRAPVVMRANLSTSGRRSTQALGVLDRTRSDGLASLAGDVEVQSAPNVRLRAGGLVSLLARREVGVVPTTGSLALGAPARTLDGATESASHLGAWAETTLEHGRLSAVGGVRVDRLPLSTRITADPRLSVAIAAGDVRLRAAIGGFHQGTWRPSPDAPTPVRLFDVPTTATHYMVGAEGGGSIAWRVDAFLKDYGGYEARGGPPITTGSVRGLEMTIRRAALADRTVDGWLSYTAARSRVRLRDGSEVPGTYDVSHAGVAVATWRPARGTRLGITSRVGSGAPVTSITGSDSTAAGWLPRFASLNDARLPVYARTDLRLTQLLPAGVGLGVLFVEAINVFDRRNASGYAYDLTWRQRTPVEQFFARRTYVVGVEWQRQ
jgi:hypothetical protein